MEKIFYVKRGNYPNSECAVKTILVDYFGYNSPVILRTENGKPYLESNRLHFSITHTKDALLIAVCDENVGIDAEKADKVVDYLPIIKRFCDAERREITDKASFLRHFTAKESAVKWLGGTLARDFRNLQYVEERLSYGAVELPTITVFPPFDDYIISVTSEKDFSNATIVTLE